MARRRDDQRAAVHVPAHLLERPATPEAIAAWGPYGPRQCDEIQALYRWMTARRTWCEETGVDYRKTFTG